MARRILSTIIALLMSCSVASAMFVTVKSASGVAFNTTQIPGTDTCGDNVKDSGEVCDGTDLNSKTCATQGFDSGTLTCASNCQSFITSACIGGGGGDSPYDQILTLGDSHTLGQLTSSTFYTGGFRFRLQQDMLPVDVNMLGPIHSNPTSSATYDVDHAGIGGQKSYQINARVPALITGYLTLATCEQTAIIWQSGANDLNDQNGIDYETAYDEIVDGITRFNIFCPNMVFIYHNIIPNDLGQVINSGVNTELYGIERDQLATDFNAGINTRISTLQETMPNLWYVDMNAAFKDADNCGGNVNNCLVIGGTTHPNGTGYELMGEVLANVFNNGCTAQNYCRADPIP